MAKPMPTMMRKLQNTSAALGQSAFGHSFSPLTVPFQSWVRMKLPSFGISMA